MVQRAVINKIPLVLQAKQNTFDPYYIGIGESSMIKNELQEVAIAVLCKYCWGDNV